MSGAAPWKSLIETKYPQLINLSKFGDKYKDNILYKMNNPFWMNIVTDYYSFYSNYHFKSKNVIEASSFLYNTTITVGITIIASKTLIENDVFYIHQIQNGENLLTNRRLHCIHNARPVYIVQVNSLKWSDSEV